MTEKLHKIHQILEDHLNSINESNVEIQALFDYVQQVETKIDKLTQRLDSLQLGNLHMCTQEKPNVEPLTQVEKQIFLVLYTEETPLTFKEIAHQAKLPTSIIAECVSTIVQKGIPLQRSFFKDQLFIKLDPIFKEQQAKQNVVNLSLQSFME